MLGIQKLHCTLKLHRPSCIARPGPRTRPQSSIVYRSACRLFISVYTQTSAFSYSLFYLHNQIKNYKQTTKSAVCVNYDYATGYNTAVIDDFLCDVTHTQKFDYYSADHTLRGSHALLMCCGLWGKPDYECISACNSACKIATWISSHPVYRVKRALSAAACYIPV